MDPQELRILRCVKCGAPISEQLSRSDYVECSFCGYTQKLVDMREYVDKLRGEIQNWVRSMVPPSVVVSQIVDPMARHNIFIFNIKPKILGEYVSVKSRLSTLLTNPLFVLPFCQSTVSHVDPKKCFENLARVQSIEPMAVVDEDKSFFDDVQVAYETYAHVVNAFELISAKSDLSFLIKNFEQVTASLERLPHKATENKRMHGVAIAYHATDEFLKGNPKAAKQSSTQALSLLSEVIKEAAKSTAIAVMVPATITEISVLKALQSLIEASSRLFEVGRSPTEILPVVDNYFRVVEELRIRRGASTKIYEELCLCLKQIIDAKNGAGEIEILPGSGDLMVPVWVVSLTYTFATGTLLWKKGKDVEEKILVSATWPLASQPVTDIFGTSAGLMDQLAGRETTLSNGFAGDILTKTRTSSVPSKTKIIPPLLTKEESERFAESYLDATSRRLGGKIRFSVAHSVKLVYAPVEVRGDDVFAQILGSSQIRLAPHLDRLMKISL